MIDGSANDSDLLRFLDGVKNNSPVDALVAARLAIALADSGQRFQSESERVADVASTGGPTSLSTLLCPLFLRVASCVVVKLGVPGRPAGGIDCLAQLPGYKTELTSKTLEATLRRCGYAHFLASGQYAPLDARVFRLRQQHGYQNVATLVAASLLSKKLAVGVRYAGLDIRVAPHGNFGSTWEEGRTNATVFASAADMLGIVARPILTEASFPYQPYIGRKEALASLWLLFESRAEHWLSSHLELCRELALACAPADGRDAIKQVDVQSLRDIFYENLEAQGASPDDFVRTSETTLQAHAETLHAQSDGFVEYSMVALRRVIVEAQNADASGTIFADPVGLVLLRRPGEWVRCGEPIATMRVDPQVSEKTATALRSVVKIQAHSASPGFEMVKTNG